jgi:hypothetical protein
VSAGGAFTVYDPNQQQSEVLNIQNLVKAAGVYALAALDLCGSKSKVDSKLDSRF